MRTIITIAAVALVSLVAVVGVAYAADIGPFAPSAEERIAAKLGKDVNCWRSGLTVVAGERETLYRCSFHRPAGEPLAGQYEQVCAAIVEGRVYGLTC